MLASLVCFLALVPQTVNLTPTDDIWVYPHATDPSSDAYLRVWGMGGHALPEDSAESSDYGFSLAQWSIPSTLEGKKLVSAKLHLFQIANPKFTVRESTKHPLEARPGNSGFSEKTWQYTDLAKFFPVTGSKAVFGTGCPDATSVLTADFEITIDLLKGPNDFAKYLTEALTAKKPLALDLTTSLDITGDQGDTKLYKLYSKDAPAPEKRPRLELVFE